MRYFLTLLLIALVSTSEIIDKAQEINELAEYDNVELQFLGFIPIIGKIVSAVVGIFTKAKAFIAGTKIFKAIKTAAGVVSKVVGKGRSIIMKGKALIERSKIFQTGKKIIQTGKDIYNKYKGLIKNNPIVKRVTDTYTKVKNTIEHSKVYQTYKKIKETYDKGKEFYDNVKNYYEKGKDFYEEYLKPKDSQDQNQQQPRTTRPTARPTARSTARATTRSTVRATTRSTARATTRSTARATTRSTARATSSPANQLSEKQQALYKYGQLRANANLNPAQKKNLVNNQVNYMLARGFITPAQKQAMTI
jgi:hypothetical protein